MSIPHGFNQAPAFFKSINITSGIDDIPHLTDDDTTWIIKEVHEARGFRMKNNNVTRESCKSSGYNIETCNIGKKHIEHGTNVIREIVRSKIKRKTVPKKASKKLPHKHDPCNVIKIAFIRRCEDWIKEKQQTKSFLYRTKAPDKTAKSALEDMKRLKGNCKEITVSIMAGGIRSPKLTAAPWGGNESKVKMKGKSGNLVWTGPPNEKLEGGWPDGWIKKVFERKNGATKGRLDRYWCPPDEGRHFRSLIEVKRFLKGKN